MKRMSSRDIIAMAVLSAVIIVISAVGVFAAGALSPEQKFLKRRIDDEINRLVKKDTEYSRNFFIGINNEEAIECLRYVVDARLTRPQLKYLLHRIHNSLPNKICQAGDGVNIKFSSRNFTVEMIK